MVSKLSNTKWDVSNWPVKMKVAWQKKMFNQGYTWKNCPRCEVIHLGSYYYFVGKDKEITHSYNKCYFEDAPHTPLTWGDAFPEKKMKPSIFENPKWVTAVDTDLEVGLVEGKDYKVYKVEEDKFWVYNGMHSPEPIWYRKDRFHKVTYEDLLPEKETSEESEEGFEDLVINLDALSKGSYIVKPKFSEEQLSFMQQVFPENRPAYTILHENNLLPTTWGFWGYSEIYFNDTFKHKSEI